MSLSVNRIAVTPMNSVSLKSNDVNFQGRKRLDDEFLSNKSMKTSTKLLLGATALASAVTLFIAGRKGHLGQRIQKFLGEVEKIFEKGSTKTNGATPEAEKAVSKAEEVASKADVNIKNPEAVVAVKPNIVEAPKSIAQTLKEAGIVDDKLAKTLEEEGISVKIVKQSTYEDWKSFVGELRESGEYGDKIKKVVYIFPEKTKEVLMKEGVDVSKLPKNTYLISASDANEKTLCTRLVLADELNMDLKIKQVRPYAFGSGCNVFDI